MSYESPVNRRLPVLTLAVALSIIVVGGWHYIRHMQLEAEIEVSANENLRGILEDATANVSIQPLTNLVSIQVQIPLSGGNQVLQVLEEILADRVARELEPQIDRKLATAARADIDLYAMLVPYHVSIDIDVVQPGFSRLVQEVQNELLRFGFDIGEADGVNGPKTTSAISSVQGQLGRTKDGQATQELLDTLRKAEPKGTR